LDLFLGSGGGLLFGHGTNKEDGSFRGFIFFSGFDNHFFLRALKFPPFPTLGLAASQEPELPASGLQLQLEASEDTNDEGAQEVTIRQCLPSLPPGDA